jgi:hypothetical protein
MRLARPTYAMSAAEIAAQLGISTAEVKVVLRTALTKLRTHPELCTQFRAVAREKRRMLDDRGADDDGRSCGWVPDRVWHRATRAGARVENQ